MDNFSLIAVFTDPSINFKGNTAAVIELSQELDEPAMQEIAADLNQPATTFLWKKDDQSWHVRWFAPDGQIGLCGHGSLAAFAYLNNDKPVSLYYEDGVITGHKLEGSICQMSIAPIYSKAASFQPAIEKGLGISIKGYFENNNKHLVLVENESEVKNMTPDFAMLRQYEPFGYVVTAPGDHSDFVCRTIVPKVKQLEDPATGSSHAALTPFWAERLGKNKLTSLQLSARGGKFDCEMADPQVVLTGQFEILANGKYNV